MPSQSVLWLAPADVSGLVAPNDDASYAVEHVPVDESTNPAAVADVVADEGPDCLVCEAPLPGQSERFAVLRAVVQCVSALPVVVHTADPDGHVASDATAIGIDRYCYGDDLWSCVDAVLDDAASTADTASATDTDDPVPDDQQRALHRLHEIVTDHGAEFETTAERLLDLGCEYLGLSVGFVTRIRDGRQRIVTATGDYPSLTSGADAPIEESYCRHTVESDGLVGYRDASIELADDPAYERFGLGCYLGGRLDVDGTLYGTLCFADDAARDIDFSPAERRFVEVMVDWFSEALEHRHAEDERERAAEQFEQVLERIDDAFLAIDDEFRLTYANHRAASVFGSTVDDLIGEDVRDVLDQESAKPFVEECRWAIEQQEPVSFERYADALSSWLEVNAYPASDGLSVYFRDVTDRKRRESMLDDLLDSTRRLMFTEDAEDVAEVVVDAAESVFSFPYIVVRLYDDETDELRTVASYSRDSDMPAELDAAASNVALTENRAAEGSIDDRPVRAARHVKLGDYGVVCVGSSDPNPVDEVSEGVLDVLAANATAALERAASQERLREYETVLENVNDMVFVIDSTGRYSYVTAPFAAFVGCDRDEIVGDQPARFLDSADMRRAESKIDSLVAGYRQGSITIEATVETTDGDRVPCEVELTLLPSDEAGFSGAVGVVRDISDLQQTREELEAENERFQHLFEHIPDPVVENTFDGDEPLVDRINPAFERVFGYEPSMVVGRSINDLIVPDDAEEEAKHLDKASADSDLVTGEVRRKTATGERDFLFRGISYRVDDGEGRDGYGIYTDITDQKERERRLQILHTVLRHNLRTELTLVRGYTDLLAEQVGDQTAVTELRRAVTAIENLSAKARTLERVVAERTDTEPDRNDVMPRIESCISAARETFPAVEFVTDFPETATAVADDRLELALENLLENAVEHGVSPDGDGAAEESPPDPATANTVTVSASVGESFVEIRVDDDGPGIPRRERQLVQGERDITQLEHGSGLGLWIVAAAVRSLDGELTFVDEADGCTVVLRLRR
ncbi:PAS domain S-box protein [Haloarchaeobius sp. DFWS5]|uniref:PAS domain S-box protein n=1 Tax=Haloarchaeobius sp. DFWS5 TaxID=3446114 RepID=UPI003EBF1787